MKDHTDRAGIRCVITAIALCLFTTILWGPLNTIWIGPWIYEGATIGTMAWRKAWVINGWILFAPIFIAFGYGLFTMFRAIRKDELERDPKHEATQCANAEFIAAANPAAVLALIAENELLRATKKALVEERQAHIRQRDQLKAEVARSTEREILQLAEIEALRAVGRQMVQGIDDWNESMEKVIGKQVGYHWPALEEMRALSKGEQA